MEEMARKTVKEQLDTNNNLIILNYDISLISVFLFQAVLRSNGLDLKVACGVFFFKQGQSCLSSVCPTKMYCVYP